MYSQIYNVHIHTSSFALRFAPFLMSISAAASCALRTAFRRGVSPCDKIEALHVRRETVHTQTHTRKEKQVTPG